ncbi:glycoside hydrolase family 31 protein [Paenibacillus sp. GD4]|uniref:TIM-barrel domain-containing protein n=1 Tax=Paenibacillus sp. GD4 TaxID=3068890 RepID=UPI002796BE98|nr:TIM-barrel domain-containing protein [Paenibacillus sp. GD4]MDQ1910517.1 glycoside hydrolase family 31 protein [Paenibacillus sp. GD4]
MTVKAEGIAAVDILESPEEIVLTAPDYTVRIRRKGFGFSLLHKDGRLAAGAHPVSGIRLSEAGGGDAVDAEETRYVGLTGLNTAEFRITTSRGTEAAVALRLDPHAVRMNVIPAVEGSYTLEVRTASQRPVFGMGDFGAHVDRVPTEDAPERGKLDIPARDTADVFGLVRNDVVNQGTNMRFISTFCVFPAHGFAQVLFEEGSKRVALTEEHNLLGAAGVRSVKGLYYFIGDMKTIYADYRDAREAEGYPDRKPKYEMFRVGWEAYGSLGWNSYQSAVEQALSEYAERGYELAWGVIGSGFWKGDRKLPEQGSTVSFGIWDDEREEHRTDELPNPRYPDPEGIKRFFAERGMKLLIGIRNHFKAPAEDGGYHHGINNGPYVHEAMEKGYLLKDAEGQLVRITNAEFPRGTLYMLDARNPGALSWFLEGCEKWEADGYKEDAMVYTKHYRDGNWNPLNEAFMDRGCPTIVRSTAYSAPGDVLRINDTYYGKGEGFHFDQDRVPINLLNYAASGVSNLYPDITGGTPKTDPTLPSYQDYFVRNATFNALCPAMSMGRKPWEMQRPEYEAHVKKAADWHNRYAPYIYSAVITAYETGFPAAMTPLPLAYPDDPATYGLANRTTRQYEWLLGPSLLAAPLFGNDFDTAETRDVYLPEGSWIEYETGKRYEGPAFLRNHPIPKGAIPVFVGGAGVTVCLEDGAAVMEVYPVAPAGTEYRHVWNDGVQVSVLQLRHEGWEPARFVVESTADLAADGEKEWLPLATAPRVSDVTGALRFVIEPGRSYRLRNE